MNREGAISFVFCPVDPDWETNEKEYCLPKLKTELGERYLIKHADRRLEVGISPVGADWIVFQTRLIPTKSRKASIVLRWSEAEGMRFSLNGELVDSRPLSKP